ncbi:hypothetical protein FRB99_004399 [Tulasnella sp. 403]|nr:hypothetical protein FRB99_004399 [Tulasnella sp. 403]
MTSNQAIVLGELSKPIHKDLILSAAAQALKDIKDAVESTDAAQLAVDWMTVKLGEQVLPHLDANGYVLAQSNPSLATSTEATVEHARRFVRLYGRTGTPRSRVCIKIPSTLEGLRACRILQRDHGTHALATTVFCVEQALAAAEEADCLFTSPYVNPLHVHFVPGTHVEYADPVNEMRGMRVTAEIQREFRRRNVRTQVLAASLVTLEETVSLSGVDRVTLSPGMLEQMLATPDSNTFKDLRQKAIASYNPNPDAPSSIALDAHFPLDEPATELKAALNRPGVRELIEDAVLHFRNAERQLVDIAEAALAKVTVH